MNNSLGVVCVAAIAIHFLLSDWLSAVHFQECVRVVKTLRQSRKRMSILELGLPSTLPTGPRSWQSGKDVSLAAIPGGWIAVGPQFAHVGAGHGADDG